MTPSSDHYFTAEPASAGDLRTVRARLAGRDVEVVSAAGVFSPDGVDKGTRVLLAEVPPTPDAGTFLDLGCGWGPLALTLALQAPAATVYAVDVNRRALDLCRRNAEALALTGIVTAEPHEVPQGLQFDLIWSNPPIRVGKAALHAMLSTWLPRLAPGGAAYLVVQRNLGADSLHAWLSDAQPDLVVERHASDKGFRVLAVHRR